MLFAVVTVFNMNLLQGNSLGDVSLDSIAVMAQAYGENSGEEVWVFKVVDYEAQCPNNSNKKGVKLTCQKVENPPSDVTRCLSGQINYLGCD